MKTFIEIQAELMPILQACLTVHSRTTALSMISDAIQNLQMAVCWSRLADRVFSLPMELDVEEVLHTGGLTVKPNISVQPMPTMLGTLDFLDYISKGLNKAIVDTEELLTTMDPGCKAAYNTRRSLDKLQEAVFCITLTTNQTNELAKRGYSI